MSKIENSQNKIDNKKLNENPELSKFLRLNLTKTVKITASKEAILLDMKNRKLFHDTFYKKGDKNFDQLYEISSKIDKIYRELAKIGMTDYTIPLDKIEHFLIRNQQINEKIAKLKKIKNSDKQIKDELITRQKVYQNLINSGEKKSQTISNQILEQINNPDWQEVIGKTAGIIGGLVGGRFAKNPESGYIIGYGLGKTVLSRLKERFNYEVNELNIPIKYIELVENSGFSKGKEQLKKSYENFKKKGIEYDNMIKTYVSTNSYGINLLDAYLIFGYTTQDFFSKMNNSMRSGDPLDKNQKILINRLREALEKLPDGKGKLEIMYRGDNYTFKDKRVGNIIDLKSFTSCSNPETKSFREGASFQVTVENAKAKDITKLALFPNFGDKLKINKDGKWLQGEKSEQESVILPGNKLQILSIQRPIGQNTKQIGVKQL
ncbi:hypothetical protein AGMMS50249_1880 [candidate division SR1 bacterium]|nr:hypothetical protein AGMMS50249_1880 [candidate division SR1 bacterium]